MTVMIFDNDRKTIHTLARTYGMSYADARQMLAIERGIIASDVKVGGTAQSSNSLVRPHGPIFSLMANILGTLSGLFSHVRSHR